MGPATDLTTSTGDYAANAAAFKRSLLSDNLSPATVRTYTGAVVLFGKFLQDRGMPQNVGALTREHVEMFIQDLAAHWKPATAANRYRGLRPQRHAPSTVRRRAIHELGAVRATHRKHARERDTPVLVAWNG